MTYQHISSTQPLPAWRSILFVPVHMERFVTAAHTRGADAIQLDLEDSVPVSEKPIARDKLGPAVQTLQDNDVDVIIRINRDLKNCIEDLQVAVVEGVRAITIPKVMGPEHLRLIDEHISELEIAKGLPVGHIRLIGMIETIEALLHVEDIAKASPRLGAITIGSEDLSYDGGFEPTFDNLRSPSEKLIWAAQAAHVKPYGFPGSIAEYNDLDLLENLVRQGKSMGFQGAFCIHPKQVDVINRAFQPSEADLAHAQKIVDAYETALSQKQGAIAVDGKMIDLPVVQRARALLSQSRSK